VEKLVEQARALGSLSLSEFVDHIADLKLRESREGEATMEETGAVRLMTVHKAKGLEFPLVWIADAASWTTGDPSAMAINPDIGVAVDARSEAPGAGGEQQRPASLEMIRSVEREMDRAENRRLLYVAATRARDRLFVSGSVRHRLIGDHWLGLMLQALGIGRSDEQPSRLEYPGGSVDVRWHAAE
jgi:ATP-dependent exoDNAse (exonuclease V) beta subunit